MSQQNLPSKHHYIPAFYLRRWEDRSTAKLIEFTKPIASKLIEKPKKAESTGYVEKLYSMEGYEPELAQQIETQFFAPIDQLACMARDYLERFGHQAPWESELRSAWTRFVRSLMLRCPEDIEDFRKYWRQKYVEDISEFDNREYRAVRRTSDPEELREYLDALPVALHERNMFEVLCKLIDDGEFGLRTNQMEWRVIESPDGAPTFLTSDRPVIRTHGLIGRGAHLALPISPRLLFIATPDSNFLNSISKINQIDLVKEVNRQVVAQCQRFVYGCNSSQRRFIENRFGTNRQQRLIETLNKKV